MDKVTVSLLLFLVGCLMFILGTLLQLWNHLTK